MKNPYKSLRQKGSSTLEILIAFAILLIGITAVIVVGFGNQSNTVDTETNNEALYKAQALFEEARARSRADFVLVITASSTELSGSLLYRKDLLVSDLTQCKKQATSTITWATTTPRAQKIELTTFLSDIPGFFALGGDCAVDPPTGGWNPPTLFASDTINSGKFNALDVLQKIVYLGADAASYLFIADVHNAVLGQSGGMIVSFANGFNSDGKVINEINDIDAYKDFATGKVYAFVAMASTTAQLAVIDVTNINNPVLKAKRGLASITSSDSTAWGWRIYTYDDRLYITARETGGPELHIFDISNPENPVELGSKELNTTVNDFVVRDGIIYLADESNARGELLVYNVSDPGNITEIIGARQNFSGDQDGRSIYLIGNKLYFGRDKTSSGPEFYILDASSPAAAVGGLSILGQKEIGRDAIDIRVAGRFAFLSSFSSGSGGLEVWDISNPASIQSIHLSFDFGNKPAAIDSEGDFVYAASETTPNFQILYSPL